MAPRALRPSLRPVESIVVPDPTHGQVVVLRDTQGITSGQACIPPTLLPILARFNGSLTCAEIARAVSAEQGRQVSQELVEKVAEELDDGLFLEGPTFRAALEEVRRRFHDAPLREASHAGGAYLADADELITYLDDRCLARAGEITAGPADTPLTALIAPHIDPWRGAVGYGHAYATLRAGLAEEADTFIVFGTSHAPMAEPFALCRKGFATPLGPMPADVDAIDQLAAACAYDPYTDELNHKREHSIEFQAVFLKHVLGSRKARIIPILAGLGNHQSRGRDPAGDARSMALLDAVRALVEERGRRAVVVAGADLAHVGPRFGDAKAFDEKKREKLGIVDGESLTLATRGDAGGFWKQVAGDLDTRRVCGLSPIYAMLQVMRRGSTGEVAHYEQTVDPDDGSIVSHAAVAFRG